MMPCDVILGKGMTSLPVFAKTFVSQLDALVLVFIFLVFKNIDHRPSWCAYSPAKFIVNVTSIYVTHFWGFLFGDGETGFCRTPLTK